jgi:putative aldouronate transport system substrate-binding protein
VATAEIGEPPLSRAPGYRVTMTLLDLLEDGVMISSKALGSPNFTAMMQFIDWLYYSDAG